MKDWDMIYKEEGVMQKKPFKRIVNAVDFFKRENANKILDLGCGTGRCIPLLLKKGFKVYGCDLSKNALKTARKSIKGVSFEQCDMTSLPYEDGFFEGVFCCHVIQHGKIADIKKAVSEIHRVLGERGALFLKVISKKHSKFFTGEEIEPNTKINTDSTDGKIPHHFFPKRELVKLFSNFEIIRLRHFEKNSELEPDKKSAEWELYARKLKGKAQT